MTTRTYTEKGGFNNPEPKEWLAENISQGYVGDYKPYNFVDGEGIRCSLYVSGCPFNCIGCYNKAVQNPRYGKPYTQELHDQILKDLEADYCQGLTLLGGEPMLNTNTLLPLVKDLRQKFGDSKDIWVWSGYTFEELLEESKDKLQLLELCDVLVDGRFDLTTLDTNLKFRGSSNQRILNIKESLKTRKPTHRYDDYDEYTKTIERT